MAGAMLAAFKRSLEAAGSSEAVHEAANAACPNLRAALKLRAALELDRSELAAALTLYGGVLPHTRFRCPAAFAHRRSPRQHAPPPWHRAERAAARSSQS